MQRLLLFILLFPFFSIAQVPKQLPNTYVNDYTHTLSVQEILQLNQQIKTIETQTTVQIAVLLIDELPARMSIEEYSREVGNKWKVGKNFNGIVYVAALKQHKQRLEIARNLEGTIPDVTAKEIIDNLKTALRQQDYYGAMQLLITQISEHLGVASTTTTQKTETNSTINSTEQNVDLQYVPSEEIKEKMDFDKKQAFYNRIGNYVIGLIILGIIAFLVWAKKYRKKYIAIYTRNGVYYGVGSSYYDSVSDAADGDSDSSFGSFGGGGGGGFSGGGASGSW